MCLGEWVSGWMVVCACVCVFICVSFACMGLKISISTDGPIWMVCVFITFPKLIGDGELEGLIFQNAMC